ncbi:hypothetical protein GOBAR_DD28161 [Gossypium barbadense]|nr:hypothetical protein GOBAR_DD28161 [Gossypium barbadense]
MDELNSKKWARDDVKRLRDDLFLNDSDSLPLNHDLASVMKNFGDLQPNLGYLLEVSDDEPGLPSQTAPTTDTKGRSEVTDFVRNPNYDSFEFGFVDNFNDGTVVYDGLLKYSEVYYDSSDISGQLWLFETLSVE